MKLDLERLKQYIALGTPEFIKRFYRVTRYTMLNRSKNRWCPVCEKNSYKFLATGKPLRKDARCPYCLSLERHRFEWYYLKNYSDLFNQEDKNILHIAPEKSFESKLKRLKGRYITADLFDNRVMVKMDIADIQYPDNYFDVILCSHVLEHVQNDRKALGELFRVLKKDGWALLIVPIHSDTAKTTEDPSIANSEERLKRFGQKDHVRKYGIDFVDRLKESGFTAKIITPLDYLASKDTLYMGIKGNKLFFCTK